MGISRQWTGKKRRGRRERIYAESSSRGKEKWGKRKTLFPQEKKGPPKKKTPRTLFSEGTCNVIILCTRGGTCQAFFV